MSEIKHTPGPWAYIDATKEACMQYAPKCVIRAGSVQVASFSWGTDSKWWPSKEESQANARLIAAAPELLECLQATFDMIGDRLLDDVFGYEWLEKSKAVIAKATGSQS